MKTLIKQLVKGKVCAFIDAANIFYSQQTLRWRVDYKRLKEYLESECELQCIYYFTGKVGSQTKQKKFIRRLQKLGYQVIAKEVKMIKVSKDKFVPKGNLDIELALDAYRLSDTYDTLLLFSGDSDFDYLLYLLQQKGKRTIVISTRGHISRELLKRAKYVDLPKLKEYIEFKNESTYKVASCRNNQGGPKAS